MQKPQDRGRSRKAAALLSVAVLVFLVGGCPVDLDALATDVLAAALDSASNSIVDAFSTFLALP